MTADVQSAWATSAHCSGGVLVELLELELEQPASVTKVATMIFEDA
jgi:hypothetical protein